jgi:hypothetical protein
MASTDCIDGPHKYDPAANKDHCYFHTFKPALIDRYDCPDKGKSSPKQSGFTTRKR